MWFLWGQLCSQGYVVPMGPTLLTAPGEAVGLKSSQSANQTRSNGPGWANQKQGHCWGVWRSAVLAVTMTWDVSKYDVSKQRVKLMKLHSRPHVPGPRPPRPLLPGTLYCFSSASVNMLLIEFLISLGQFELHFSITCNWKRLKSAYYLRTPLHHVRNLKIGKFVISEEVHISSEDSDSCCTKNAALSLPLIRQPNWQRVSLNSPILRLFTLGFQRKIFKTLLYGIFESC